MTMTSNDENLLPENYHKHKKNMLDSIKKKYGLTDEEAEEYYYLDPTIYSSCIIMCCY